MPGPEGRLALPAAQNNPAVGCRLGTMCASSHEAAGPLLAAAGDMRRRTVLTGLRLGGGREQRGEALVRRIDVEPLQQWTGAQAAGSEGHTKALLRGSGRVTGGGG